MKKMNSPLFSVYFAAKCLLVSAFLFTACQEDAELTTSNTAQSEGIADVLTSERKVEFLAKNYELSHDAATVKIIADAYGMLNSEEYREFIEIKRNQLLEQGANAEEVETYRSYHLAIDQYGQSQFGTSAPRLNSKQLLEAITEVSTQPNFAGRVMAAECPGNPDFHSSSENIYIDSDGRTITLYDGSNVSGGIRQSLHTGFAFGNGRYKFKFQEKEVTGCWGFLKSVNKISATPWYVVTSTARAYNVLKYSSDLYDLRANQIFLMQFSSGRTGLYFHDYYLNYFYSNGFFGYQSEFPGEVILNLY